MAYEDIILNQGIDAYRTAAGLTPGLNTASSAGLGSLFAPLGVLSSFAGFVGDRAAEAKARREYYNRLYQAGLSDLQAMGIDPYEVYNVGNMEDWLDDYTIFSDPSVEPSQVAEEKAYQMVWDYIQNPGKYTSTPQPEPTSDYINSLTGKDVQAAVRDVGNVFGSVVDSVFGVLDMPPPDYAVLQPGMPGGTIVWGEPSGSVFGKVGTTPGGTTVGVQTGSPVLDVILGKAADIAVGRAGAGDIVDRATIEKILVETAAGELGLPAGVSGQEVLDTIKKLPEVIDVATGETKFGVDTTTPGGVNVVDRGGEEDRVTDTTTPTDRISEVVPSDYVPSDRITATDIVLGGKPADMNEPPPETATEETPTGGTADEVPGGPGGGGVGLGGYGVGMGIVSGAPGEKVDIDYLYDIGGESIFGPTLFKPRKGEEKDDKVPYVYKKTGGMIGTYDPVEEAIRLLTGG
jgi:hypothetical protein